MLGYGGNTGSYGAGSSYGVTPSPYSSYGNMGSSYGGNYGGSAYGNTAANNYGGSASVYPEAYVSTYGGYSGMMGGSYGMGGAGYPLNSYSNMNTGYNANTNFGYAPITAY